MDMAAAANVLSILFTEVFVEISASFTMDELRICYVPLSRDNWMGCICSLQLKSEWLNKIHRVIPEGAVWGSRSSQSLVNTTRFNKWIHMSCVAKYG